MYLGRHRVVWRYPSRPNYGQAISLCVHWVLGNPGPLGAHPCPGTSTQSWLRALCPRP